ncbi:MAG: cell division protein ZipA C-terminal FtsZ-binding domain-containing protein [Halothiobacillaceae bacterium]
MEDLLWILLGLGALVLLGLYLSRKRRGDTLVPLGDELEHDPLEATPVARRAEPRIEDITHWDDESVGPVRRRFLDEEASQRPSGSTGPTPATEPPAVPPVPDRPVGEQPAEAAAPVVVPIYLIARDPQGFAGDILLEVFARYGFEFGEMDVYHHVDAHGHILFSLMNGVAPGTFDLVTLPKLRTPALALFLRLPIPMQPSLVFEQFIDIAHRLAEELDATLLDERREVLSTESIDRMREITLGE